jgi:hypothetical protein
MRGPASIRERRRNPRGTGQMESDVALEAPRKAGREDRARGVMGQLLTVNSVVVTGRFPYPQGPISLKDYRRNTEVCDWTKGKPVARAVAETFR